MLRAKEEGYDYIMYLAPDHVLPNKWLKVMYDVYTAGNLEGFLAFQARFPQKKKAEQVGEINGSPLYLEQCDNVYGCWFSGVRLLDIVGYINEEYKYYGSW